MNKNAFNRLRIMLLSDNHPCPIIVFTDDADRVSIEKAIAAGISAYVVQGYAPQRIVPVIDTAIHRFNRTTAVAAVLNAMKLKLEDRKLIEQAKGIVMKKTAVDEAAAYKTLRDMAMNSNVKMSEIARSIVTAAELLV
jgi:response regulator NasT